MLPVLLQIGGFSLYSYGFLIALAFAGGIFLLMKSAHSQGLSEEKMLNMSLWIMVASVIGSRLLYILIEPAAFLAEPWTMFDIRSGGLSFHGGLAFGIAAGLLYTRHQRLPQGIVADLVALPLALGYALVRIGCLLNGCCFGRPSALPWALPAAYLDPTLRHPTQLYAFLSGIALFALLLYRRPRTRFNGQLFLEFIIYYSIYRFIIEFFREADLFIGFLTLGQAASLIVAVAVFTALRLWPFGKTEQT